MAASFFFYDLETTGFDPRYGRIMQFAGQRTDLELKPVGEPVNVHIKLTPDVLPSPDAVLVTGITPQQTVAEGVTEAEFLKIFFDEVVKPGTIFAGFNNIRFDDEFMRFLLYRNFYDAYEWQWKDDCSRWDLLDVVRMTRALRPEGIQWPFAPDGKPANRLEFLTSVNKLSHEAAHDALSDVKATIAVAKLIREKHRELFDYLLSVRNKRKIAEVVEAGQPFVYTSGRFPGEHLHTTAAVMLTKHPQDGSALVYDLRHDPLPFLEMNVDELAEVWKYNPDPDAVRLPVKTIKYNRTPAVAPMGVIKDKADQERIGLTLNTVAIHLEILKKRHEEFSEKLLEVVAKLDETRGKRQADLIDNQLTVDARLYDNFISDADRKLMPAVRGTVPEELNSFGGKLSDERLKSLLPLYKARNYPASLAPDEREAWDRFCQQRLFEGGEESRLAKYFERLQQLATERVSPKEQYLLEELQLYGQSIVPSDQADDAVG